MKNIDKKIYQLLIEAEQSGVFPGSAASIYLNTGKMTEKILLSTGNSQLYPRNIKIKKHTFFDLASLSKPLSTILSLISVILKSSP